MGLIPPDQIIKEFFDGLDLHKIDADLRLAELQNHCTKNRDPKTCFLTVAFTEKKGPVISWGFRLTKHLGSKEITFPEYLDLVHPAWQDFYNAAAQVAYIIAANEPTWARLPEACYMVNVPLRQINGEAYRWFRQVSIPAMVDPNKGMLAAHLNYYTDLGPYEDHLPELPTVYALFPDDPQEEKLGHLQEKFVKGIAEFSFTLTQFLTDQDQDILKVYRSFLWNQQRIPTLSELEISLRKKGAAVIDPEEIKRRTINLKTARTRLAKSLKKHLHTDGPLADPANYAKRLNLFFGDPDPEP